MVTKSDFSDAFFGDRFWIVFLFVFERPRAAQERLRAAQERLRVAQERPRAGQERAKSGQERPKSSQESPKSGQKCLKSGQKRHERQRVAKIDLFICCFESVFRSFLLTK